jgi:DNA-binding transcriptional MerR regulator
MSQDVADHVAVEVAGKAAGIPARTLRHWVASGKLSAIAGKRGKLVSMREVEQIAALVGKPVGKPVGNAETPSGNPATFADEVAGKVAEAVADTAIVTDAARQQLASIRDEWLAPLVAQITEQAQAIGRLELERDQLRAEVEALRRQAAPQPLSEAATFPTQPDIPDAQRGAGGLWQRVRRAFGGG